MISTRPFRSPYTQVLGFIVLFIAVLACWLMPASSAHADGLRPHYHRHGVAPRPVAPPPQHQPFYDLSPEQQAVLDWVVDTARNKLSIDQARTIVIRSYEQANRLRIDPLAFIALIRVESRFDPHATSNRGAKGLMQVRASVHKDKLRGRSPYDIETSLEVGAQILGDCVDKYPGNLYRALNCYSGGGGRAYNELIVRFHKQVDHSTIFALFREPDVLSYRPETAQPPPDLPKDEAVYQVAMK